MDKIILHIDFDAFYASLEEQRNPDIKDKPVVVCIYSGRSEDSGAVSTANYAARELGIKSGMPIFQAKRLAKDSDVVFLPADRDYYAEVSGHIMEVLEHNSDAFEQASIDEAYLDITSKSNGEWDSAKSIAKDIKKQVFDLEGITCTIGIGPNKFVAKMASKANKPDGLTVVMPNDIMGFLSKLPVEKLHGVGKKTADALAQMGIKTVDNLAKSDISSLEMRFGKNKAQWLYKISRGIDESLVEPRERQQISRIGTLKEDSANETVLFGKISKLAQELERKIHEQALTFRTVSIILIDTNLKTQTRSETIDGSKSIMASIHIARKLLNDFLSENPNVVIRRIGIQVSNFERCKKQRTLGQF